MAEDPKQFLRDRKAGIGESQLKPDGSEGIVFQDYRGEVCGLCCDGSSFVTIQAALVDGRIILSLGQAQRFINSVERWVRSTNFGKMEHQKYEDPAPNAPGEGANP